MPVRIPASTSNLGAGFDCVGVAIARWLEARVEVSAERAGAATPQVTIARTGTLGALDAVPPHADHLYRGFALACARAGAALPARLAFDARSDIPVARGLGSSAAALVAGAALAVEALGLTLARLDVASIAAAEEGHGDNAGPCALGGAVLAVDGGAPGPERTERFVFRQLALHADVALVFAVPDFALETRAMRAALPPSLPHATAVAAASRAAALVHGLATGDGALLRHALDDVLHVPFRRALVPGYDAVCDAAARAGAHGATLSGAGSSIVALAPREVARPVAEAMADAWRRAGVKAQAFVGEVVGTGG